MNITRHAWRAEVTSSEIESDTVTIYRITAAPNGEIEVDAVGVIVGIESEDPQEWREIVATELKKAGFEIISDNSPGAPELITEFILAKD